MNPPDPLAEPPDHAVGRSRGGLSTKIHQLVDGNGMPLVVLLSAGQAGDSPMFGPLMAHLRIGRDAGRSRTRPDAVRGDKAYSSRAIRGHLRSRGVVAIIPEPADQQGHRKRRGSRGGRPPAFDADAYKGRNVIERRFCHLKQWRGIATRYDSSRAPTGPPLFSTRWWPGHGICQTSPSGLPPCGVARGQLSSRVDRAGDVGRRSVHRRADDGIPPNPSDRSRGSCWDSVACWWQAPVPARPS